MQNGQHGENITVGGEKLQEKHSCGCLGSKGYEFHLSDQPQGGLEEVERTRELVKIYLLRTSYPHSLSASAFSHILLSLTQGLSSL